jgi:TonB family protein
MIKAGIDKVKGSAQGCGGKSSAKGAVKVRIKATPEGKVGSVEVVSSPDDALGRCVASALKNAKFAKTQRGMVFAYTLSF